MRGRFEPLRRPPRFAIDHLSAVMELSDAVMFICYVPGVGTPVPEGIYKTEFFTMKRKKSEGAQQSAEGKR